MPFTTRKDVYDDAVAKLKPYINGTSKEDFVATLLLGQDVIAGNVSFDATKNQEVQEFKKYIDPIIDVLNGGYYATEILQNLDSLTQFTGVDAESKKKTAAEQLGKAVRFTLPFIEASKFLESEVLAPKGEKRPPGILNGNGSNRAVYLEDGVRYWDDTDKIGYSETPSKSSTRVAVIELLNSKLGLSVRDTTGVSIFSSMVPPHIMARAVPYVAVRMYGIPTTSTDGSVIKAKSMSILRYLKGDIEWDSQNPVHAMLGFNDSAGNFVANPGGMELFTAPQTMVTDAVEAQSGMFRTKPIDRFRPLMSLSEVSFDVASAGAGFMSFKTAKMGLVLHDRGRMAEVAPFVKAGLYGTTEIEIEYGWSIDSSAGRVAGPADVAAKLAQNVGDRIYGARLQDDVFAQFIDSLRVTEKYIIVNSNFNFDESGQVNISLDLSMKGAAETQGLDVTGDVATRARQELKKLIEDISAALSTTTDQIKSLYGDTLLGAVSSEDAVYSISDEDLTKVNAELAKLKNQKFNNDALKTLSANMQKVFVQRSKVQSDTTTAVQAMFQRISGDSEESFPACQKVYEEPSSVASLRGAGLVASCPTMQISSDSYTEGSVSLGRALVNFIGVPLYESKKFDEIQFIFNKMNDRAGFMRSLSLASFPLDRQKLREGITKLYQSNVRVSVSRIIAEISDKHIGDIAHPAYGFSTSYNEKGELVPQQAGQPSTVEKQLQAAGIKDANFQKPRLSVRYECVPHWKNKEQTILRIYVSDEACTAYQEYAEAINAARSDTSQFVDIEAISTTHPLFPDSTLRGELSGTDNRKELFTLMEKEGVITRLTKVENGVAYKSDEFGIDLTRMFKGGEPDKMKNFMRRGLPVIRYGSSAGLVKSLSVSSISDPRLNTVNQLRNNESTGQAEASAREKGLPLLVNGTEVQLEMVGNPLLNFGQNFYIDFGTGTSVDNIYVVTGLSHKLSPGEFSTSAKLTLMVGGFGIYTSQIRQFKSTALLVQYLSNQPSTPPPASEPPKEPLSVKIYSDLKLNALGGGNTLLEKIDSFKKKRPLGLRVWMGPANYSAYFKLAFDAVNNIEVVLPDSPPIQSIFSQIPDADSVKCYTIQVPSTSQTNVNTAATLFERVRSVLYSSKVTVLMEEINKDIEARNAEIADSRKRN